MGFFGKLFKGPEIDQARSDESKRKMRRLFDSVVPDGGTYQLMAAYTEDVKRFNYGLVPRQQDHLYQPHRGLEGGTGAPRWRWSPQCRTSPAAAMRRSAPAPR